MIVPSVDCFEDAVDDFHISSERVPIPIPPPVATDAVAAVAVEANGSGGGGLAHLPASAQRSAVDLMATLSQPGITLRERVALLVMSSAFSLVTEVLAGLAERRIAGPATPASSLETLAMDIVAILARSAQHEVLNAFFFRPLIARAGIRAKIAVGLFFHR